MHLIYIDESGNTGLNLRDSQQPVFVLAAMIVPADKWFDIEKKYYDLLSKYFPDGVPDDFELHAVKLKNGTGYFKAMPLQDRMSLRDEVLQLVEECVLPVIYRRIQKSKFDEFCKTCYGSGIRIDPYIMAFPFICTGVDQYLLRQGGKNYGMLILDEQESHMDEVEKSVKTLRLAPDSLLKTSNLIEKAFFVDSRKSFALQIVDIVAYYVRKMEEKQFGVKVSVYDEQTFDRIVRITSPWENNNAKAQDVLKWVKDRWVK